MIKSRYFNDFKRSRDVMRSSFNHWLRLLRQKQAFDKLINYRACTLKSKVLATLKHAVMMHRRQTEKHKLITAYFTRRFLKRIFVRWMPAARQATSSDLALRTLVTFFSHWRREFQRKVMARQLQESKLEQIAGA